MRYPSHGDYQEWDEDILPPAFDPGWPTVDVTDNPVIATLLGPDGEALIEITQRPPFGFALP